LIKGKISPDIDFSYVLSFEELNDGYALACQSSLRSDIEIEVTLKNNRREK
jgi:CDP-4-dehydro-6-deoxyglucose reductase